MAPTVARSTIDITPLRQANLPIIFIIGGPGSGKGTQCAKIVEKYGYTHLSSGDLLRDEVASGSERGKQLTDIMQRGELVPLDVVLDLLKEAMLSKLTSSKGFLIDGYPREVAQGIQFESEINPCALVIYFELSDDVMTARLMNRGLTSGRMDDNEETIRKRLDTFHKHSLPVVEHYGSKCRTISAEAHPDEVFQKVAEALETLS
ncbi:adenylate kinase isoenzyme 1-like [Daphnia carinata]|uniref:adenylate kinase isoenzyme 1-like n=1 Tax=Daphnia carinata TaxID=120202 RepID=UPI00257F3046|nr:adenylate kinase isoenzyme 1-like [Daphnia carinata]